MPNRLENLDLDMNVGSISIGYGLDVARHLGDREELEVLNHAVISLARTQRPVITRDEYRTWVKCWKKLYNKVSDVIRLTKSYRDGHANGLGGNTAAVIHPFRQHDVHTLRGYARDLMAMRAISKIIAEHSYQKLKNQEA